MKNAYPDKTWASTKPKKDKNNPPKPDKGANKHPNPKRGSMNPKPLKMSYHSRVPPNTKRGKHTPNLKKGQTNNPSWSFVRKWH